MKTVFGVGSGFGSFVDEEFPEKFTRSRDGRNSCTAAGPAHLATAMNSTFRANGERRESSGATHGFGGSLVEADVPFRTRLGVHGKYASQEGMHGEVSTFDSMVEP